MSINGINDKVFVEHKINSLWTFNVNLSKILMNKQSKIKEIIMMNEITIKIWNNHNETIIKIKAIKLWKKIK